MFSRALRVSGLAGGADAGLIFRRARKFTVFYLFSPVTASDLLSETPSSSAFSSVTSMASSGFGASELLFHPDRFSALVL